MDDYVVFLGHPACKRIALHLFVCGVFHGSKGLASTRTECAFNMVTSRLILSLLSKFLCNNPVSCVHLVCLMTRGQFTSNTYKQTGTTMYKFITKFVKGR